MNSKAFVQAHIQVIRDSKKLGYENEQDLQKRGTQEEIDKVFSDFDVNYDLFSKTTD